MLTIMKSKNTTTNYLNTYILYTHTWTYRNAIDYQ